MTLIDLSKLPGISLEALNERASLMHRVDRKYVVTQQQFVSWLNSQPALEVLEIDGRRAHHYASTYLDTPQQANYRAAAHKRRRRFKVRTRTYLDSGERFIEVKVRDSRGQTTKVRTLLADTSTALDQGERDYVAHVLSCEGVSAAQVAELQPMVTTSFTRNTLYSSMTGARITVDTELSFSIPGQPAILFPDIIVLETKSGSQDRTLDRALWRLGVRPEKVSKFAIGTSLLNPELPNNKWHRIIQRHFSTHASAASVATAN